MSPLVSIAIPAFKTSFLDDAILSVLNQTYQNWELIVVDDCSPENIACVVHRHMDARIHYYRNEINLGGKDPVANWNKCLSYATGDYFCLLCDDDTYEPSFIETMLDLSAKYSSCSVFKSRVKTIDKKGEILGYFPCSPEWESTSDYLRNVALRQRKQTISEWMFRTERMRKCGGYAPVPMAWGSDYLSALLFSVEGGICASNAPLTSFRRSGINISNNYSSHTIEKIEGTQVYAAKLLEMISANHMAPSLIPDVEIIRQSELRATMTIAKWKDYWYICTHKKQYGIKSKTILWTLAKRLTKV